MLTSIMKAVIMQRMFSLLDYLLKTHIYTNQFPIVKISVLILLWWHYLKDQIVIAETL